MNKKLHSKITEVYRFECLNHNEYEPRYTEYFDDRSVAAAWLVAHDMKYHGVR